MEVAWPPPLLAAPVVSYTTFSPLPHAAAGAAGGWLPLYPTAPRGGLFLWPFSRITPPGRYPALCSAERGLSSGGHWPPAIARPARSHVNHRPSAPNRQRLGLARVHTKFVGTFRAKGHADGVRLAAAPPNEPHHSSPTQGNADSLRMHPLVQRELFGAPRQAWGLGREPHRLPHPFVPFARSQPDKQGGAGRVNTSLMGIVLLCIANPAQPANPEKSRPHWRISRAGL